MKILKLLPLIVLLTPMLGCDFEDSGPGESAHNQNQRPPSGFGSGSGGGFGFGGGSPYGGGNPQPPPPPPHTTICDAGNQPQPFPPDAGPPPSMCGFPSIPEAQVGAACSNVATRNQRAVAHSESELKCRLIGRWRKCLHFAGPGRPWGAANFAGVEVNPDGRFTTLIDDGLGHVVRGTQPDQTGFWTTSSASRDGTFTTWSLHYDDGQSFEVYGVFALDGSGGMVSDLTNAGSVETHFVRTQL